MPVIESQPDKKPDIFGDLEPPSMEEVEASIIAGERMIRDLAKAREGKLPRTDPEVMKVVIHAVDTPV